MQIETQVHYVLLDNDRRASPHDYMSLESLFKEMSLTRKALTYFNERDQILGFFGKDRDHGPLIHVYDYTRSMMPVCTMYRENNEGPLLIYIKTTELVSLDDLIANVKATINALILRG